MKYLPASCLAIFCLGGSISTNAMEIAANLVTHFSSLLVGTAEANSGKILRGSVTDKKTEEKTYTETFCLPKAEGFVKICEVDPIVDAAYAHQNPPSFMRHPINITIDRNKSNCVIVNAVLNKKMVAFAEQREKKCTSDSKWINSMPWSSDAVVLHADEPIFNKKMNGLFRGSNRLLINIMKPALYYEITVPYDADVEVELQEGNIDYIRSSGTNIHVEADAIDDNSDKLEAIYYYSNFAKKVMRYWQYKYCKTTEPRASLKTKQGTVSIIEKSVHI